MDIAGIQQLTLVSVTSFPERLPTAYICIRDLSWITSHQPTQMLFCLWVIPGIAMLKVLVGYDRPAWVEMRTAPFKQSYFMCGQCDHGKLW